MACAWFTVRPEQYQYARRQYTARVQVEPRKLTASTYLAGEADRSIVAGPVIAREAEEYQVKHWPL